MRSARLVAMLIPLLILAGCAKKVAKNPAPPKDEVAAAKPEPTPPVVVEKSKEKPKKDDEPNWLNPPPKVEQPGGAPSATGKLPWGITPPEGGWQKPTPVAPMPTPAQPQPQPQPAPGPSVQPKPDPGKPGKPNAGGMGKLDPQPQPAKPPIVEPPPAGPAVTQADMKDVWVFIEGASLASGKMPTPALTFQALVAAKSPAAALVKSGAIFLVPTTARESVWAFDMQAFMNGGDVLVASQNGLETVTAAQLKSLLGK